MVLSGISIKINKEISESKERFAPIYSIGARGGSGTLPSFTAPQEGLLHPPKVYCSLPRFTAASLRFTAPPKVDCTNSKRFSSSLNN